MQCRGEGWKGSVQFFAGFDTLENCREGFETFEGGIQLQKQGWRAKKTAGEGFAGFDMFEGCREGFETFEGAIQQFRKLHTQGGPRRRPAWARARQGRRINALWKMLS